MIWIPEIVSEVTHAASEGRKVINDRDHTLIHTSDEQHSLSTGHRAGAEREL